jgi:hypothetical protein
MGAKIPVLGYIVRRKCPVSSSSYELHKKLQNLYASVRFRPAPPSFSGSKKVTSLTATVSPTIAQPRPMPSVITQTLAVVA